MTHVHYKFSSRLSSDTVLFDGPHITLSELKRQIMGRERLRAGDCDLQITNAQTQEEYTDDQGLIPKGSSVIVRRIPVIGSNSSSKSKTRNIQRSDLQLHHGFGSVRAMDHKSSSGVLPIFTKMTNLAEVDVSEEEKLKVIVNQSAYDSMAYSKNFVAVLPANYTCYRCGNTGHHIRNCPSSGDKNVEAPLRLKKSTGIPRSFMVEVDDPNIKGAMLTNCGHYAIPAIHAKAYAVGKKESHPFIPQEQPKSEEKDTPVPDELLCLICRDLLSDAVVIPCCGNSYCDDCIRTTLLDSEEHDCPTCSQSHVSPDTLIANKFLRQAVNTFKKEQGHTKTHSHSSTQSQNPTPAPSTGPTLPPVTMQSQPPKPLQLTHSQQDPLRQFSQAADTPPASQVCGAPPTGTGPAPASNPQSTSPQPAQSHLEASDREPEEEKHDDSAVAALSLLAPNKDPAAAESQLTPPVGAAAPAAEVPQTDGVKPPQSSSGQVPGHPSECWERSSTSSVCAPGSWTKSNTQQLPPLSSPAPSPYPSGPPPPLFPPFPHFHMFLAAQQHLNSYPAGYPPTTPVWTLQTHQGAPIPSLCSSIPSLITKEWPTYPREKTDRSPNKAPTYKCSSSRSNSKSSKSKSSRSYSHSSSRSRSRSRSKGRSRLHSPYSHSHSRSSHSYSYGYKRSPTPSSSSPPPVGDQTRSSKSSSGHRKSSHHSRHHSKKSTLSKHASRKREESSQREAGGSGASSPTRPYDQHAGETTSPELDRQRYQQWKSEYKDWCEKYFNTYVSHFNQLPPSAPLPPWQDGVGRRNPSNANSESLNHLKGGHPTWTDDRTPPSQSSSDSRSPPSQSSRDRRSKQSQSSRDSRPSTSHSSIDSHSSSSHSTSAGCPTLSGDRAQQRSTERSSQRGSRQDDKHLTTKKLGNLSTLKHERKKKHEEEKGEESSSPDAADSMDQCGKHQRKYGSGPNACKNGAPAQVQDEGTACEAIEADQPPVKPRKRSEKGDERNDKEGKNVVEGRRGGRYSDSRQDRERRHKHRASRGSGRTDTDGYRNFRGSRASDSESENRKRKMKEIEVEVSSFEAQCSESPKTNSSEVPDPCHNESPVPYDRKRVTMEKKKEIKTWPLIGGDIWEGGIKVKPQKKINININLDGKRKGEESERQDLSLESVTGKLSEATEKSGSGDEVSEVDEVKESTRNQEEESKERIKPDEGEALLCKQATIGDDEEQMKGETAGGRKEEEREGDLDLWNCFLMTNWSKIQSEKSDETTVNQDEELKTHESVGVEGWREEERRVRNDDGGQQLEDLAADNPKVESAADGGNSPGESQPKVVLTEGMKEGETTRSRRENRHDAANLPVDDGCSDEDQERKMLVKTLEEVSHLSAADIEDELVLMQVPRLRWEKQEYAEGFRVQPEALAVCLPSSSVSETPSDVKTESEHQRIGEAAGEMVRGPQSSHRSLPPSGGKDGPDTTSSTEKGGERERTIGMEKQSDKEKWRSSERPRERQGGSNRSKERRREEGRSRSKERERRHSSKASALKRDSSSSCSSHLTSRDAERRERRRGDDQGGSKRSCSPGGKSLSGRSRKSCTADRAAEKTSRDEFQDAKLKEKDHSHSHSPQDPSGHHRHLHRPAGAHHSSPSLSRVLAQQRDPFPSEFFGGSEVSKTAMSSPGCESTQDRNKVESKEEKEEWNPGWLDKLIKDSHWEREGGDTGAERKRSGQGADVGDELDGRTMWTERGERPGSSSKSIGSSASHGCSGGDDDNDGRNEWRNKQKKHKREEDELKKSKHKKSE